MRGTVGKILTDADTSKPASSRVAAEITARAEGRARSLQTGELARYGLTSREIMSMTDEQRTQALDTFNAAIETARDTVRANLKRRPK